MSRQTPFSADHRRAHAVPGVASGRSPARVGSASAPSGDEPGFQLSQRADYIEVEVGLETTLKRGIINTRDEPHADADKYRRLHVIIGDANLAETSTYLKVGTTLAGARPDRGGPVDLDAIWRWPGRCTPCT